MPFFRALRLSSGTHFHRHRVPSCGSIYRIPSYFGLICSVSTRPAGSVVHPGLVRTANQILHRLEILVRSSWNSRIFLLHPWPLFLPGGLVLLDFVFSRTSISPKPSCHRSSMERVRKLLALGRSFCVRGISTTASQSYLPVSPPPSPPGTNRLDRSIDRSIAWRGVAWRGVYLSAKQPEKWAAWAAWAAWVATTTTRMTRTRCGTVVRTVVRTVFDSVAPWCRRAHEQQARRTRAPPCP